MMYHKIILILPLSLSGAFLIPFFFMLIICGVPLMYMELAIGQYTRQGPIGAIAKLCPFFKGHFLFNYLSLQLYFDK